MMRPEDAAFAASLGARYVGVIFAEGPRTLTAEAAEQVMAKVPRNVARVGVFGTQPPDQIAATAARLTLDVVQLHGDPDPRSIGEIRNRWSGQVWAVQRVNGAQLPEGI